MSHAFSAAAECVHLNSSTQLMAQNRQADHETKSMYTQFYKQNDKMLSPHFYKKRESRVRNILTKISKTKNKKHGKISPVSIYKRESNVVIYFELKLLIKILLGNNKKSTAASLL